MNLESFKQNNSEEKRNDEKPIESPEAVAAAEMIQINLMNQMLGSEASQEEKIEWVSKNADSFRKIFSANEEQFIEMYQNENSRKDLIELFKNILDKEKEEKKTVMH